MEALRFTGQGRGVHLYRIFVAVARVIEATLIQQRQIRNSPLQSKCLISNTFCFIARQQGSHGLSGVDDFLMLTRQHRVYGIPAPIATKRRHCRVDGGEEASRTGFDDTGELLELDEMVVVFRVHEAHSARHIQG